MSSASPSFAVDLGSATLRVLARQTNRLLRFPMIAALDHNGRISARGHGALALQDRRTEAFQLIRPVAHRSIADTGLAARLLHGALSDAVEDGAKKSSAAALCVPDRMGTLQTETLLDVCRGAGLRRVRLVPKSLAAAVGSGVSLSEPAGALMVDVGAQRSSAAMVSFGDLVLSHTVPVGGVDVDIALIRLVRRLHGLTICPAEAHHAKLLMGTVATDAESVPIQGHNALRGRPEPREIQVEEMVRAVSGVYDTLAELVRTVLAESPPKLVEDVFDRGLLLCGEGARLRGLTDHLRDRVEIPVHVPDQPGDVGVLGAWEVEAEPMTSVAQRF